MDCLSVLKVGATDNINVSLSGFAASTVSASDSIGNRSSAWGSFLMTGNIPTLGFARLTLNPAKASTGSIVLAPNASKLYPATVTNRFFWQIEAGGMTLVSSDSVVQIGTVYGIPPLAGTQFVQSSPVNFYQSTDPTHTTVLTLKSATATITPPGHTFGDKDFIMNQAQEVPATGSAATATGVFELDTLNNKLHFDITHNVANESAAHIHGPAARGANAGVLFGLPAGLHKVGVWDYPQSMEADLLAGRMYANIHSTAFPGGEIRGQIEPAQAQSQVPTLTEWGIMLLAGVLLILSVFYLRQRRLGTNGSR